MKKLLRVLSHVVLYLPNLAFIGLVLLSMLADSSATRAGGDVDYAEYNRNLRLAGLGVLAATVLGWLSKRAWFRLLTAGLFAAIMVYAYMYELSRYGGGDSKGMLFGMGLVLGIVLATLACMLASRLLGWIARKLPEPKA